MMLIINLESGEVVASISCVRRHGFEDRTCLYKEYYDAISQAIDLCKAGKSRIIVTDPHTEFKITRVKSVKSYKKLRVPYFNRFGAPIRIGWRSRTNGPVHYTYEVRPDHISS